MQHARLLGFRAEGSGVSGSGFDDYLEVQGTIMTVLISPLSPLSRLRVRS